VESINRSSQDLQMQLEDFIAIAAAGQFKIYSFYETKKSRKLVRASRFPLGCCLSMASVVAALLNHPSIASRGRPQQELGPVRSGQQRLGIAESARWLGGRHSGRRGSFQHRQVRQSARSKLRLRAVLSVPVGRQRPSFVRRSSPAANDLCVFFWIEGGTQTRGQRIIPHCIWPRTQATAPSLGFCSRTVPTLVPTIATCERPYI